MKIRARRKMTISVFIFMVLALPILVIGVKIASDIVSRAGSAAQPTEVVVSNVSATAATISWFTEDAVEGSASAVNGATKIAGVEARENPRGQYKLHYINLTNLKAGTNYTLELNSGGQVFTDALWKFTTPQTPSELSTPSPFKGKVSVTGTLSEGVAYAVLGDTTGNSTVASTLISKNNTFVLDRNNFLDTSGKVMSTTGKDIVLYVNGSGLGKGIVQFAGDKEPTADIKLSAAALSFDPLIKITPGATLVTPNPSSPSTSPTATARPESLPVSLPVVLPNTDAISEQLLSSTYNSGAEQRSAVAPYNLFVSNLGSTGFTVNWATKHAVSGFVEVNDNSKLTKIADSRDSSVDNAKKRYTHSVDIKASNFTAGTIIKFLIYSDSYVFGTNIPAIADDLNTQFAAYGASASDIIKARTNTRQDSADLKTFKYSSAGVAPSLFAIVIPAAPSSPPAPRVLQGTVSAVIAADSYSLVLADVSAKIPAIQVSAYDLERDYVVYGKTKDGLWSSGVSANKTYTLSLGSTLKTTRTAFVSINNGDPIEVRAIGMLNQNTTGTTAFADAAYSVSLSNGSAVLGILPYSLMNTVLLAGVGLLTSTLSVSSNAVSGSVKPASNNVWQYQAANLGLGYNTFNLSGQTSYAYILNIIELPITGLKEDVVLILSGISIIGVGLILRKKYLQKKS